MRTLYDYEIPAEYWDTLEQLRVGVDVDELTPDERSLVQDFHKLELTSEGTVSPAIWETMEFE